MSGLRVTRIEINSAGAAALLKSDAVLAELTRRGEAIAAAAGGAPDFTVTGSVRRSRAHVSVATATLEGRRAEATDRVLSSALDAGR